MTIQQEYAEDLIDIDALEITDHMAMVQIAGTLRAMYWANKFGDKESFVIFAKSLTNEFFDTAMEITERKLDEANVYQDVFDQMYDMGHSHGDFLWLTILEMSYFYIQKALDLKKPFN